MLLVTTNMESIVKDFGIQPILLAAQVVNFLILLLLLKRFLYKPVLKVLDERKKKVAQSLKDAEEIEKRLQKTVEEQEKALAKAAKEASGMIDAASKSADQIISEAHAKSKANMAEVMESTQQAIQAEREKLSQEIRVEVANLISLSFEKITGKALSKKDQETLVKRSIKEI